MNLTLMSKDLETKKAEIATLMTAQMAAAEKDGRVRTPEEIKAVDDKMEEARGLKARIERAQADANQLAEIERLTGGMVRPDESATATAAPRERRSLGAQLIESVDYRSFIKSGMHRRSGSWVSPAFDLMATTLSEDSGSGGPLLLPQVLPGILPLLFKRLTIADLIAPGTTDSNAILYLKETTFTNASAATAEGTDKPQSTLVFAQATSPVQKLAHWLPVTEEMLEDYSGIRSYIDSRLRLGLDLNEEDELLNGSGTPPHLQGLMGVSGIASAIARGSDNTPDAILKQITAIATNALVQPEGVVMNPANWQTVQLMKDSNGQYYGSGPFAAPQVPRIWGLPVAVTPSIVANTALVGAFRSASQIFRKGGVRVEVSNSHSDFFIKNLVAIRAEERLALAIYRPAAFGKVTGLN